VTGVLPSEAETPTIFAKRLTLNLDCATIIANLGLALILQRTLQDPIAWIGWTNLLGENR